jgi:hypothetical protein
VPIFEFECRRGHVSEDLFLTSAGAPRSIRCPKCRHRATRIVSRPAAPNGDVEKNQVPAHFNPAFGEVVKDRKHMKVLQEKHGTQDWRPVAGKDEVKDMLKRTNKTSKVPRE